MSERISGPYRGYYISATAERMETGAFVGTVNVAQGDFDNARRYESLIDLGSRDTPFETEDQALEYVEQSAREYVDRLFQTT